MATQQTKKKTVETEQAIDMKNENESLKKQLEEQENKMKELMAKMEMMTQIVANQSNAAQTKKSIASQRKIEFVNMIGGTLILKGSSVYEIVGRFNSATYPEQEAQVILANTRNAIQSGYAYITDSQFVEENNLSGLYSTILNNNELKNLLDNSYDKVLDIYKNSSDGQKNIIIEYVTEKLENGQKVDANVLVELSKLSGVNLMQIGEMKEE